VANPTAVQKRALAKMGYAMPDGSYYIRAGAIGASDLQNAIDAVGRGEPQSSHNAIRKHIMKRAKALGLSDKIPDNWQADGSLKHSDLLDQMVDDYLEHFGIVGMRWGHHLPGVEVLGGPGNGDRKPSPFIQRGDHTGDKPGDSGPADHSGKPPEQQAQESMDFLKALRDHVTQATASAKAEADGSAPTDLSKEQANAVHAATAAHLAQVAQLHNKATAATATHKATQAKIAKQPKTVKAKRASAAAKKLHATHMKHLAKTAHQAHAAHKAHVTKLKSKSKVSELTAHDKAALAKLSPVQRSALKKLTPQQRATLNHMTAAQKAKLSHLTQAEKNALSHLSPAQKSALAKATAASAKKRHEAAVARKAASSPRTKTSAPVAAGKLRAMSQHSALDGDQDSEFLEHQGVKMAEEFLEHFGVKGMHWGVRHTRAELEAKATMHEQKSVANAKASLHTVKEIEDLRTNGVKSAPFKRVYGDHAHAETDREFYRKNRQSKAMALQQADNNLRMLHNYYVSNANHHSKRAVKIRAKAATMEHGDTHDEVGEFLEHHGIKGMKWGVRRNGGHPGRDESHPVSLDAQKAHEVAQKIHQHGTAALSNEDLQHLVNRQRLLQQHAQLNPAEPSNVRKGLDFVKTLTNDTKTVIDAVDTGRRAVKTINGLQSERPPHHQSRRTRNKPLRVVSVKAA